MEENGGGWRRVNMVGRKEQAKSTVTHLVADVR